MLLEPNESGFVTTDVVTPADLEVAVADLVHPLRARLRRSHGHSLTEWADVPSLFMQLVSSVGRGSSSAGLPSSRSRPPISVSVLDLLTEIRLAAAEGAEDYAGSPTGDTVSDLLTISSAMHGVSDYDPLSWWTDAVRGWVVRARTVLGMTPPLVVHLRGVPCPACNRVTVKLLVADEVIAGPALMVSWEAPTDYVPEDIEYRVSSIRCRGCHEVWARGEALSGLAFDQLKVTGIT